MQNQMKVSQFYNKNQFVIEGQGVTTFQSYDSTIAIIDSKNHLTLGCDWDYSNTTRKHLYLFLNDYSYNATIQEALQETNKRKAIQKLIDDGFITYNQNLK